MLLHIPINADSLPQDTHSLADCSTRHQAAINHQRKASKAHCTTALLAVGPSLFGASAEFATTRSFSQGHKTIPTANHFIN